MAKYRASCCVQKVFNKCSFYYPFYFPPSLSFSLLPSFLPLSFLPSFSYFFSGNERMTENQKHSQSQIFLSKGALLGKLVSASAYLSVSLCFFTLLFSLPYLVLQLTRFTLFPMLACPKSNYSAICLMVYMYSVARQQEREQMRTWVTKCNLSKMVCLNLKGPQAVQTLRGVDCGKFFQELSFWNDIRGLI